MIAASAIRSQWFGRSAAAGRGDAAFVIAIGSFRLELRAGPHRGRATRQASAWGTTVAARDWQTKNAAARRFPERWRGARRPSTPCRADVTGRRQRARRLGLLSAIVAWSAQRPRLSSRPSTASTSKMPGEVERPVAAARSGWAIVPSLAPCSSA